MPLFEFQCPVDNVRFERLLGCLPDDERAACPQCGAPSLLVPSLPVMRPDTMWAGEVHRNYGYHTSESSLKAEMKRRNHEPIGDRTDREAWEKIADDAQKDKDEKLKNDIHDWNVRTWGPGGLGLGGADGEKFIKEHS